MKLSSNWFSEPTFDFELKRYQFLAFQQAVQRDMQRLYLYPTVYHVNTHVDGIERFLQQKRDKDSLVRGDLQGIDLKKAELLYQQPDSLDEIKEVEQIIDYALPRLIDLKNEIGVLRTNLLSDLACHSIGVRAANEKAGYLYLNHETGIWVYQYAEPVIQYEPKVTLNYVDCYFDHTLSPETIKKEILGTDHTSTFQTWYVTGGETYPLNETLAPLARQIIYELIQ